MYFPEANVLVPTRSDPRSKTPAFKSILVTISPTGSDFIPLGVERSVRSTAGGDLAAC